MKEKLEGVRRKGEKMRKLSLIIPVHFMSHSTGSVCRSQRHSV